MFLLFFLMSIVLCEDTVPLSQRYLHKTDMNYQYSRGTYLIVLSGFLDENDLAEFINFKKTQGYNVEIVNINDIATSGDISSKLRQYLYIYYRFLLSPQFLLNVYPS